LTLSKVGLTVALGVLLTESDTPAIQPVGILTTVACPDGAGVAVVTTFVDGTLLSHNIGLQVVTQAGADKHLDCLDTHFRNVLITALLRGDDGVAIGIENVDKTTPLDTLLL
jgi:hypothetical protein